MNEFHSVHPAWFWAYLAGVLTLIVVPASVLLGVSYGGLLKGTLIMVVGTVAAAILGLASAFVVRLTDLYRTRGSRRG